MDKVLATLLVLAPLVTAADVKTDLMANEKKLWAAWGDKDGESFKTSLTPDAVQVIAGTAPLAGRDAIVKSVATLTCEMANFSLSDGTVRQLTPDVIVLTYTATQDTTCGGVKLPPKLTATAVYVRQDGKWLQANYQETPQE
jgi:uncharacterized protein (TIGR02246 family)